MNKPGTILIVDDSKAGANFLRALLAKDKYEIHSALTGYQAIEMAILLKPDIILLDIGLPDMSGFEVCRILRKNPYISLVPIVMLTAFDDRKSRLEGIESGADEFIIKPYDAMEVKARVKMLIKLNRFKKLHYDELTDLPNELLLKDMLHVLISNSKNEEKRFSLLIIKLKNIIYLSNKFFQDSKNLLFDKISEIFSKTSVDIKIVSHNGNGDFILIISDDVAFKYANYLINTFSKPITIMNNEILLNCSIGISTYPDHGIDSTSLLANAKTALLYSEERNNSFLFYEEEMSKKTEQKILLVSNLYNAIERDEFVVYYQPQIESSTGKIIGLEALVRWDSPDYGFVFPDFFITLAEETGYIIQIGEIVLRKSLAFAKQIFETNFSLEYISVNISVFQFSDPNFINIVKDALNDYNINPKYLKLEITESLIISNPLETLEKLNTLRALGVSISIDDFGTGYSALNYIKQYPATEIKIDKSFILTMEKSTIDIEIVKYIIQLAHALDLKVVAEGVELLEHVEILKRVNCDILQGYFFSRPLNEVNITKLLDSNDFVEIINATNALPLVSEYV